MNDKALNMLGLCRRAGKLTLGFDLITGSVEDKSARLVLTASDISKSTLKKLTAVCERENVPVLPLGRTKDELSRSVGRLSAAVAVCDEGFAKSLMKLVNKEENL